jgi:hypothetical protein
MGLRTLFFLYFLCISFVESREYFDLFPTPRSIAMGRAISAITDDWESVYTNPAGLALTEESRWRAPDIIQASASAGISKLYKKIKNLKSGGSSLSPSDFYSFDGTAESFNIDIPGLGYYGPRIAVALNLLSLGAAFRLRTPSLLFLKASARITQDTALTVSFAQPFFNNHFRLGVSARPFHYRTGTDRGIGNNNYLENSQLLQYDNAKSMFGSGWGYDFDLGAQAHLGPWGRFGFVPSTGVTFQNILENKFKNKITNSLKGNVPSTEKRLNIGVAFALQKLGVLKPTLSFEYRDLLIDTNSPKEHYSVGFELASRITRWLRGAIATHYYKGNVGGGLYGYIGPGNLAFITDAVNLGKGPKIGVNRRYYVRAALEW